MFCVFSSSFAHASGVLCFCLAIAAPSRVHAQDVDPVRRPDPTPPTPAAPSTDTTSKAIAPTSAALPDAAREAARFAEFDTLKPQGLSTDFPGSYETLTRDVGGFRTWLYEHDLYFRGLSSNTFTRDVAGDAPSSLAQRYTGQKFTFTQSNELRLSWKIGGSGEDITQLNVSGLINYASWRALGPSGAKFLMFNVHKTFQNRRFEVKAGFQGNISEFVGIFAGGNPILAAGLAGSIPVSTGISAAPTTTPTLNVQINGERGFYVKSGVQRSVVPEGLTADAAGAGLGLKLTRRGARPLFIQEFGVRRAAAPGQHQLWLRGGGTYNLTRYNRLDGAGRERNWMLFALADYQVWQPDQRATYRGIYVGASTLFAPDAINTTKRTLEARVYALGMIPGRPTDQMTLTIGRNRFSDTGYRAFMARGETTHRSQFSIGALYAFHATNGLFLTPSVNYLKNPSFVGDFKPAVNLALSATVLF